ncbi:MAG: hypothetical protein AMXMBFR72_11110 [Betaproteobacteria bacterium]|nr:MAG: hypothetical protein BroJett031_18260 [Betaproteobacteria bacterium]
MKKRAEVVVRRTGVTPDAFTRQAIETELTLAERYVRFVTESLAADRETQRTGEALAPAEAREYIEALAPGRVATRPRPEFE